ncbi:hypothetical protein EHP00_1495 [Ecytonucleospora hepatopenaei]|uniref:Uncharacterized protein n=1 Tax=Ecytonucleospora hepatopenaei TaxID=646526 RepID=A0A1W0E3L3_9MICR|nr:hypothetical protein EHP00_1495 [Ecytonucleospora hepatopenaei]
MIKTLITKNVLEITKSHKKIEQILDDLVKMKYDDSYIHVINSQLQNIKQRNFYLITHYQFAIKKILHEINLIKKLTSNEIKDQSDQIFIQNLDPRLQLETSRLQLHTANETSTFIIQQENLILY